MVENSALDKPSFEFGIESTIEGVGSQELLKDLFAPETGTANPEELSPIVKEVEPVKATPPAQSKVKVVSPPPEEEIEKEEVNPLSSLLDEDVAEEEKEETNEETTTTEENVGENQFSTLTKDLYGLGVFTLEEGEEPESITTGEAFLQRFNEEKRRGAIDVLNRFIGRFGEDYQDAFQAIYVNGVNPKDYFGVYNTIVNFSELDLSQESNQEAVVRQALTDQGMEPDDINAEIETMKNYGDLDKKAARFHKVLLKKEAAKLQETTERSRIEQEQKAAIKNQWIQSVQNVLQEKVKAKEFDGIPINPKLANELQDFLLIEKWTTSSGETLTDFDRAILELKRPENHALKVKVGLLLKILEKDPTLSTIQKKGVTAQANSLFEHTVRQRDTTTQGKSQSKPISWWQ